MPLYCLFLLNKINSKREGFHSKYPLIETTEMTALTEPSVTSGFRRVEFGIIVAELDVIAIVIAIIRRKVKIYCKIKAFSFE